MGDVSLMDDFTLVPKGPISHRVEVYTSGFLIEGSISGPFERVSDLVNRGDSDYLSVHDGSILPLGKSAEARMFMPSMVVNRTHVHFVATAPREGETPQSEASQTNTGSLASHAFYVPKTSLPCYAFTDIFVIYGYCYLHSGSTLQNLLDKQGIFMPITDAMIYPVAQPNVSWKRSLVLVNKGKLEVVYLLEMESEEQENEA